MATFKSKPVLETGMQYGKVITDAIFKQTPRQLLKATDSVLDCFCLDSRCITQVVQLKI